MKRILLTIVIFVSQLTFAHEFKSKDFCSTTTKDICGHVGYDKKPEKNKAFEFTADIINKVKAKEISDVILHAVTKKSNGENEYLPATAVVRPDGHHWDAKTTTTSKFDITDVRMTYKYKNVTEEVLIKLQ